MRLMQDRWENSVMGWFLIGFVAASGLVFGSCATGSSAQKDSLTESGETDPAFFDEIPADTLYLVASLDDGSETLKKYAVESGSGSVLTLWQSFMEDRAEDQLDQYPVLKAFIEEFEDVDSLEDYRELGLEPLAPSAVYGLSGLPIIRMQLADAEKFREFVNRFESEAELDVQVTEHAGNEVHIYSPESMVEKTYDQEKQKVVEDFRFHVAMTVRDGQVVTGMYPGGVKKPVLDHITGKTTPEKTLDDASSLRELNETYGFESFVRSGWIDITGIVEVMTGQSEPSELGAEVMNIMGIETVSLESPCKQEVSTLVEQVPRFVAGVETFSRDQIAVSAGLEIESEISQKLGDLGSSIPTYGSEIFDQSWLSIGMGINVEKYVDFGVTEATKLVNDPYQCDRLAFMNRMARQINTATQVVPAAARQVEAASLVLRDFELAENSFIPETIEALALVRARNPAALLAQLRSYVPGLRKLTIDSDGVPVSLDSVVQRVRAIDAAHLAMTEDYIGASLGVGVQDTLAGFLESPHAGENSPLLSVGLDLGNIVALVTDRLGSVFSSPGSGGSGASEKEESESIERRLGMSFLELDASKHGIFMNYRLNTAEAENTSDDASASSE